MRRKLVKVVYVCDGGAFVFQNTFRKPDTASVSVSVSVFLFSVQLKRVQIYSREF